MLCAVCGAWCRLRSKLLLEQCQGMAGRTAAGVSAHQRTKQGYLPSDGADDAAPLCRVDGVRPVRAAVAVAHWVLVIWRYAARGRFSSAPTLPMREKVAFLCNAAARD